MTYAQATEDRRRLSRKAELTDAEATLLDLAEAFLLAHRPTSMFEADELLEIIRDNVELGQRSDGLDLRAIDNLRTWLRKNAPGWTALPEKQRAA